MLNLPDCILCPKEVCEDVASNSKIFAVDFLYCSKNFHIHPACWEGVSEIAFKIDSDDGGITKSIKSLKAAINFCLKKLNPTLEETLALLKIKGIIDVQYMS